MGGPGQGHRARKEQSQEVNLGGLASENATTTPAIRVTTMKRISIFSDTPDVLHQLN